MKFKGTSKDRDRHGNIRIYFRTPGKPKIRLREQYGSPAFREEHRCAELGVPYVPAGAEPARATIRKVIPGSLEHLCQRFYKRAQGNYAPETFRQRWQTLKRVCAAYGDMQASEMTSEILVEIRDELADTNGGRNNIQRAIGCLFKWATDARILKANLEDSPPRLKTGPGYRAWTADDVRKFVAMHPDGTDAHRALVFLLFTGLRRSDVLRLSWSDISEDGRYSLTPQKTARSTRTAVNNPALAPLRAEIEKTPRDQATFLVNSNGQRWRPNKFSDKMKVWCDAAGVVNCTAHGLRMFSATAAAEAGATEHQLMAIFGWKTPKQAAHYTRTASRKRLSDGAMGTLEGVWSEIVRVPPRDDEDESGTDC